MVVVSKMGHLPHCLHWLRRYQWTTNTTLAFTRGPKLAQYSDENFPENREKPDESIGDGSQRGK